MEQYSSEMALRTLGGRGSVITDVTVIEMIERGRGPSINYDYGSPCYFIHCSMPQSIEVDIEPKATSPIQMLLTAARRPQK